MQYTNEMKLRTKKRHSQSIYYQPHQEWQKQALNEMGSKPCIQLLFHLHSVEAK